MSVPVDRELLTQSVIVFGVCFGVWMTFVSPKMQRLKELDAAIEAAAQQTRELQTSPIEPIAARASQIRALGTEIASRSRLSRDTARLVSVLMSLAAEHDIVVASLQPRVDGVEPGSATTRTRVDINGEGSYENVASFISALGEAGAYIRVSGVQIAPGSGTDRTQVKLACQALGFTLPEPATLATAGGPR